MTHWWSFKDWSQASFSLDLQAVSVWVVKAYRSNSLPLRAKEVHIKRHRVCLCANACFSETFTSWSLFSFRTFLIAVLSGVVLVIVDISTFKSNISCVLSWVEHERSLCVWYQISLYICKYEINIMLIFKSSPRFTPNAINICSKCQNIRFSLYMWRDVQIIFICLKCTLLHVLLSWMNQKTFITNKVLLKGSSRLIHVSYFEYFLAVVPLNPVVWYNMNQ